MPKITIDLDDITQFSDFERALYQRFVECWNNRNIEFDFKNDFQLPTLIQKRTTPLQVKIINEILNKLIISVTCWDIDAFFSHGLTSQKQRTLQHHFRSMNNALKVLHNEDSDEVSPAFLELIDFELLMALRRMSATELLSKRMMQDIIELQINHYAICQAAGSGNVWKIHPFCHEWIGDAFEAALEENPRLMELLNNEINEVEEKKARLTSLRTQYNAERAKLIGDQSKLKAESATLIDDQTKLEKEKELLFDARLKFFNANMQFLDKKALYDKIRSLEQENAELKQKSHQSHISTQLEESMKKSVLKRDTSQDSFEDDSEHSLSITDFFAFTC